MKNIYLCGRAGAGKSVAADHLRKTYGFTTAKFAFPVYNLAYNYFNMQGKDRRLLQVIGSDVARNMVDKDLWVNRFKQDMKIIVETRKVLGIPETPFIMDDCRFPNEHQILKEMGWIGVYLYVDKDTRIARLRQRDGTAQEATLTHPSELALEEFKNELYWIDSTCDMSQLFKNLDELVQGPLMEDA